MFNLEDYEDVATLNRWLRELYPDSRSNLITELHDPDKGYIRVRAEIYRHCDDAHPIAVNVAFGERDKYPRHIARYYVEDTFTSALGRAIILFKGSKKTATRESMEQVARIENSISEAKTKMAETAKAHVPIAKADDPWTTWEAPPVATVDSAVALVQEIIGAEATKEVPNCKCGQPMKWGEGKKQNGQPWANYKCPIWTKNTGSGCDAVIWYEVSPTGTWVPQKKWSK